MRRLTNTTGRPADVARRSAKALAGHVRTRDAFRRETFALPREAAREKAREMFRRFPKAAYMTEIESWRVLPGDRIEFTMRRLPSELRSRAVRGGRRHGRRESSGSGMAATGARRRRFSTG